ncbi:MAG: DUF4339 domain-containing protein [Erysipelotrichaceae bacterium]|nr:DUF4339 domain-containing protein [Erysipelotrichaceae bacterium]
MPKNNKEVLWQIHGREGTYSDQELIEMIKRGEVSPEDLLTNRDLKAWLPLKETIYAFYL